MLPAGPQQVQHPVDVCFVSTASARRLSGRGEGEGCGGVGPPAGPASGRSNAGAVRRPGRFLFPQRRNWPQRRRDSPRRVRAAAGGSERSGPRKTDTRAQALGSREGALLRGGGRGLATLRAVGGAGCPGGPHPETAACGRRAPRRPWPWRRASKPRRDAAELLAAASASLKFCPGKVGAAQQPARRVRASCNMDNGCPGAHCSNPFPNAMHPSKMELIIMTAMRDQTDLRKEEVSNHLPTYSTSWAPAEPGAGLLSLGLRLRPRGLHRPVRAPPHCRAPRL